MQLNQAEPDPDDRKHNFGDTPGRKRNMGGKGKGKKKVCTKRGVSVRRHPANLKKT